MQKTKSFEINPKNLSDKNNQNLLDWIFGLNNAFGWWALAGDVTFKFEWSEQKSEGNARGEQLMDLVIGLVTKYEWEGKDIQLKAEFKWDDEHGENNNSNSIQ